jgi:hypothetical protein
LFLMIFQYYYDHLHSLVEFKTWIVDQQV